MIDRGSPYLSPQYQFCGDDICFQLREVLFSFELALHLMSS